MARREAAGVDDGPVEHTPERPCGREVFSEFGQAADEEGPQWGAQACLLGGARMDHRDVEGLAKARETLLPEALVDQ